MKRYLLVGLAVLLIPVFSKAEDIRVVDYGNSSVTVEVSFDTLIVQQFERESDGSESIIRIPGFELRRSPGKPVLPAHRYFFEVTSSEDVSLELIDSDRRILEGIKPVIFTGAGGEGYPSEEEEFEPEPFVKIAKAGIFRKSHIALVEIRPVAYDGESKQLVYSSRLVFRLNFPPAKVQPAARKIMLPRDSYMVNSEQAAQWREEPAPLQKSQAEPFEFSLSDHWTKLSVEGSGIYRVTYSDLFNAGVSASSIDPGTFRLFSAFSRESMEGSTRPFQQPESLSDGGSFVPDYGFTEHSIHFVGDQSGTFDPGEYMLFYGVGVEGWLNYLDPEASLLPVYENIYETQNSYWLTWGPEFTNAPARMDDVPAGPQGEEPELVLDNYRERIHREEDLNYFPRISDDRWCWYTITANVSTSFDDEFEVSGLVPGSQARLRTIGYGTDMAPNQAFCYINDENLGGLQWNGVSSFFNPDSLDATFSSLRDGSNTFSIEKTDISKDMKVYWYQIFYTRYLRPSGPGDFLEFYSPDTTASARFVMSGFSTDQKYLFDVTDYFHPDLMSGKYQSADTIVFDAQLSGISNHYLVCSESGFRKPEIEYKGSVVSLRDEASSPEMLVIYHRLFNETARSFTSYRSANFPSPGSGDVKAVDIESVYDNFSGGLKDPVAIRNYLKYLYDNYSANGSPVIEYVMLMGKGNYDPKDVMGRGQDYIPFYFIGEREVDDFLVKLDDSEDELVDLAIGRIPALEAQKAAGFLDKLMDYEASGQTGPWNCKAVFVADDEFGPRFDNEFYHMGDTEYISSKSGLIPEYMDVVEIYLHDYPFQGSTKPAATRDLLDQWNDGALIVNYLGHGSHQQLADELVLRIPDLNSLFNGPRLPLFLPFSCTVGDLDQIFMSSLAHQAVMLKDHGAIGSIAAVAPSMPYPNKYLEIYLLEYLFPHKTPAGSEPVGRAFLFAKMADEGLESNNQRYELIGDPSMSLIAPTLHVEHSVEDIDTLQTGMVYTVSGSVIDNGSLMQGFNGEARIVVREAKEQLVADGVDYDHEGSKLFKGTTDVSGGRFSAQFVVPTRCRLGAGARIRSYVKSSSLDGAGACDTLMIVQGEEPMENDGPPDVDIYFENMATRVKKGSRLFVDIFDENGIAILGNVPQNSIFLEFDGSGYPIYVTEYFKYDHNSYKSGTVEYPLNLSFEVGSHTVVAKVFDNLGEMSEDTLRFDIVEENIYQISDVFNFPNPFQESTNFVFQLSGSAKVKLKLFTVSGINIWEKEMTGVEGFNSVHWDGRDYAGNRIGNGTYLYVIEADFYDSFNRSERVEGKVVLLR